MYNILDDDAQAVRAKLARVLEVFDYFDNEHYEAMVSGVIAVGVQYWSELYPGPCPKELTLFPDIEVADRSAPSQAYDLFIQIRADRLDIVHAIAVEVHQLLSIHVELIEDTRAFRYLDGRDLMDLLSQTIIHADQSVAKWVWWGIMIQILPEGAMCMCSVFATIYSVGNYSQRNVKNRSWAGKKNTTYPHKKPI